MIYSPVSTICWLYWENLH